MESLDGFISKDFPYKDLKKVSDLIYYEGPMLSHFSNGKDSFLYLWVDNNDSVNRWIVIKIDDNILANYFKKRISLKYILETSNTYILFTDINEKLNNISNVLLPIDKIPESYLPSDESYFNFPLPPIYEHIIANTTYVTDLIENSIHIKIEDKNRRHSSAVKMSNVMEVFNNLKSSLTNFYEVNFKKDFPVTDFDDFDKVLNVVKKEADLLMPNLATGSFCASLSIETVMSAENSNIIKEWRKDIFEKYKREVFNLDYSKPENIVEIERKYDVDERKNIYAPIIDTFKDNNNYTISKTDRTFSEKKTTRIKPISKNVKEKLVPRKIKPLTEQEEQLLQMIAITKKTGGEAKFTKKDIIETIQLEECTLTRTTDTIYFGEDKLFLKEELEYKVHFNRGDYSISYPDFQVDVSSKSFESLKNDFFALIIQRYKYLSKADDTDLAEDEKEIKRKMVELVSMASI